MGKKTDRFRKNHDSLSQMCEDLKLYLEPNRISKEAKDACRVVGKLAGALIMHMAQEDKNLMPECNNSNNKQLKDAASRFFKEMKDIRHVTDKFLSRWIIVKNVQDHPQDFIKDAKTLINSLSASIEKKNVEFYDLVDKLAA